MGVCVVIMVFLGGYDGVVVLIIGIKRYDVSFFFKGSLENLREVSFMDFLYILF